MAYNPLKLGSLTESKEALSASLYKVNTMLSELYTISNEGDLSAISQNIVPDTDSTRDLGSPEKQWRSLYVSTNTIYIGGKAVSVSEAGAITVDGQSIGGGNVITSPITLVGDIGPTETLIAQLEQQVLMFDSQILSVSGQLSSAQSQLSYWSNVLSGTNPSNPQFGYFQSQYFYYSMQVSSLTGQLNSLQSQRGQAQNLIAYHQSRLSNPNLTLGFNHATEKLEVSGGLKLTAGIVLGEGATIVDADGTPYITNALPSQTNHSGHYLTTNGSGSLSWASVFPSQTGNANKFLKTDGSGTLSWETVAISDQGLNTTDNVTFNSVTSATDFISTGAGIPSFESATNINLTAANAVIVTSSPLRVANLTSNERDKFIGLDGDIIYNSTVNGLQVVQNNAIHTVRTTIVEDLGSNLPQDIATCGVNGTEGWSQEDRYGRSFTFYGVTNIVAETDRDVAYFIYDPEKFSGGILEFVAEDVTVNTPMGAPATVDVYNRYIGTVKFGNFISGETEHFVFETVVNDTLNSSNYNFQASIKRGEIPSSQGFVSGIGLQVRKLLDVPGHAGQLSFKWKATMFSAKPQTVAIYVASLGLL